MSIALSASILAPFILSGSDYPWNPPYSPGVDLPSARLGVQMHHFWLDKLVDYCYAGNPSRVYFRSRTAWGEAERFLDVAKGPGLAIGLKDLPIEPQLSDQERLCAALVQWGLGSRSKGKGVDHLRKAIEVLGPVVKSLGDRVSPDPMVEGYADLVSGLCMVALDDPHAKDTLYRCELRWRNLYPHHSLVAAYNIELIYKHRKDTANVRATSERIRIRYASCRGFYLYTVAQAIAETDDEAM